MKKQVISSLLALSLVFGTAAVLPQGAVDNDTAIVASAGGGDVRFGSHEVEDNVMDSGEFSYYTFTDGMIGIYAYTGKATTLSVPEKINGKKVTYVSLVKQYLIDAPNITAVKLPRYVDTARISLEKGVVSVDKNNKNFVAKNGMLYNKDKTVIYAAPTDKKKYSLPNTLKTIGEFAFMFCTLTKDTVIPDGVTTIEENAFYAAVFEDGFKLPDSVEYIGNNAFASMDYSKGLPSSFKFPASLKTIGYSAFMGRPMKKIALPDGLKKIDSFAFYCSPEPGTSIFIPSTVTEIGDQAFSAAADATMFVDKYDVKVTVPATVKKIGEAAFGYNDEYNYDLTIITTKNSAADKYAKANDINVRYDKTVSLATVTGLKAQSYTGKAVKPTPTVKFEGKTLKKGTDYTLSYKNNKKVGLASVIIKGKGKYSGTLTKVFKINPKKVTISKAKYKAPKKISLKYKKSATADGYEILYSTSKKFAAKKTTTINTNKLSKTISKLKSGKTYYVKVRAVKTVKGIDYKSKYSAVKKIKVK